MAKTIPAAPARFPAMLITMKISSGCACTRLAKMTGCVKKLSTNCAMANTPKLPRNIPVISEGTDKDEVAIRSKPRHVPAIGPMYGTRLKMPAINPIRKAFGAPMMLRPSETIVVMMATLSIFMGI